jgi:hypothetical protein
MIEFYLGKHEMMKTLILILVLTIVKFNHVLYAQIPTSELLINNLKQRIYQPTGYDDIYFDLDKQSIIQSKGLSNDKTTEEIVGYEANVYPGSFQNPNKKEYLLHLTWNMDKATFFPHAGNFGPLNQFVVFDSILNQISRIYFQDATEDFKEIVDIDNNGLNELIMEGYYAQMGVENKWINVFYKDFEKPALNYFSETKVLDASAFLYSQKYPVEYEQDTSSYNIENGKFMIKMTKHLYFALSESDIRKKNEENCERVYLFKNGIFKLISGENCEIEGY